MKWWHIALIGIGGYFIYKMMKPKVAIAATPVADQASELDMLRQTLEAKLKTYGKVMTTKVAVEGDQVTFRNTANNEIIFQVATALAPEEIAQQIDQI